MQRAIISSALFHSDSLRTIPGNLLDKSVEARLASRPGYHRGSFAGERAHRGPTYAARGPRNHRHLAVQAARHLHYLPNLRRFSDKVGSLPWVNSISSLPFAARTRRNPNILCPRKRHASVARSILDQICNGWAVWAAQPLPN